MTTTFAGGNGEDAFKEPLHPSFLDGEYLQDTTPTAVGENVVAERVTREDETEEFHQKLDVAGWPQVGYIKSKFIPNDGSVIAPSSRLERVTRSNGEVFYVLWTPVAASLDEDDAAALARAVRDGFPLAGWRLTYHTWDGHWCTCSKATYNNIPGVGLFHDACGRVREARNNGGEDLPQIGMSDDEFNGFYPTIKGNDPAHWDPTKKGMDAWRGGGVMYGQPDKDGVRYPITGKEIRHGRAEYREATASYYQYDDGYFRDVDKIRARNKAERDAQFELAKERADKALPRKLGEV